MQHYKKLLLAELENCGWELMERSDSVEWWLDESWRIRSVKQRWGFELQLLFLVDPMLESGEKSAHIWAVSAVEEVPEDRPLDRGIATLSLRRGRFDTKLATFIEEIDVYRGA